MLKKLNKIVCADGNEVTAVDSCSSDYPEFCPLGDLSGKGGGLAINGVLNEKLKLFFTDTYLPLSGPYSILHKYVCNQVKI